MKKLIVPLTLAMAAVTGFAYANSVTMQNASNSVGPLKVTYMTAHEDAAAGSAHFGDAHVTVLKPGASLNVNTPRNGYHYSGVVITKLVFVGGTGKHLSKSFNKSDFGKEMSCSSATSETNQNGKLQLWLGKHRLTCQHNN